MEKYILVSIPKISVALKSNHDIWETKKLQKVYNRWTHSDGTVRVLIMYQQNPGISYRLCQILLINLILTPKDMSKPKLHIIFQDYKKLSNYRHTITQNTSC